MIRPSRVQAETCLLAGTWLIDGALVVRRRSDHRWAIYGPNGELGMARSLAGARRIIRRGMCDNCVESHLETGCPVGGAR